MSLQDLVVFTFSCNSLVVNVQVFLYVMLLSSSSPYFFWRPFIFSLVRKRIILLKVPTTLIQILYFCCLCLKCWHIVNIFLLRQAGLGPRWNLKLIMIYSKVQNDKFLNRFRHFFYLCDVHTYIYYLAQD